MNSFLDEEPRYVLGLSQLCPDKIAYVVNVMESGIHFNCSYDKSKARLYKVHETISLIRIRMMCSEFLPRVWDTFTNIEVTDVIYVYVS